MEHRCEVHFVGSVPFGSASDVFRALRPDHRPGRGYRRRRQGILPASLDDPGAASGLESPTGQLTR
ncbi:MAG: hypothetical protein WBM28_08865 [Burkholderiales bacterium]